MLASTLQLWKGSLQDGSFKLQAITKSVWLVVGNSWRFDVDLKWLHIVNTMVENAPVCNNMIAAQKHMNDKNRPSSWSAWVTSPVRSMMLASQFGLTRWNDMMEWHGFTLVTVPTWHGNSLPEVCRRNDPSSCWLPLSLLQSSDKTYRWILVCNEWFRSACYGLSPRSGIPHEFFEIDVRCVQVLRNTKQVLW